jgi:N-succinyl-L-ornithine transcarbamylase
VLTWAPHIKPIPHCVANSFAEWMIASGEVDLVIAHPEPFALHPSFTQGATMVHRQEEALMDADVVYVKNWSTFEPYGKVVTGYDDWMVTPEKLALTKQAGVMHCLPVRRNVELPDSVLDGSQSWVTQQAANRVWAAQAVIAEILQRQACSAIPIQQVITQ